MAKNTPKPWRFMSVGECSSTGEEFGNIVAANGVEVAENVYKSDAEAIIAPPEAPRILDEREVRAIAKKLHLPRYWWDTEEGRMDLARFANEASRFLRWGKNESLSEMAGKQDRWPCSPDLPAE